MVIEKLQMAIYRKKHHHRVETLPTT